MGSAEYLKTVGKAIDVLNLFVLSRDTWGPRDLARELGIDKSSAHRLLCTLREKGMLSFNGDTGKYSVGPAMIRMSIALRGQNTLENVARPVMQRYVDEINETLVLFSYRDEEMVFELAVEADHALRFQLRLGVPYSMHLGVSGRVILANIPEDKAEELYREFAENQLCDVSELRRQVAKCKKNGYATARGGRVRGVNGFSAPIYGPGGDFLGGITLGIPDARYSEEDHAKYCEAVVGCASEISGYVGGNTA